MYTIQEISRIAGVSTRTLRFYHEKGLLIPKQEISNNYRMYSKNDIDILQQILFYKELGLQLDEIKAIINNPSFNIKESLLAHKSNLLKKQERITKMINTINHTLDSIKGGKEMNAEDKFTGLKEKAISDNEQQYGDEIREKYGDKIVEESYLKFRKMTKKDLKEAEELAKLILETLTKAIKTGDPSGDMAQKVCAYHQKWIKYYWSTYSKQAHLGLVKMYTMDERFAKYYAVSGVNAAEFLYESMKIYLS